MLYREIIAVCSQIHTEHTHKYVVWWQNVGFLNVKPRGTYSDQLGFKGLNIHRTFQDAFLAELPDEWQKNEQLHQVAVVRTL